MRLSGQAHRVNLGVMRLQRHLQARGVQRAHGVVGDDESRAGLGQTLPGVGVIEQAGANADGVASIAKVDVNGDRCVVRHGVEPSVVGSPRKASS